MSDREVDSPRRRSRSPSIHSGRSSLGRGRRAMRSRSKTPDSYKSRSRSPSLRRSPRRSPRYSRSRSVSPRSRRRSGSRSSMRRRRSRSRSGSQGHRRGYRRSRSPMSSRKRHQGSRENPHESRCIGVFGLSMYTQERDLREVFSRYGPLEDIQLVYDHQTGRSRGFAFIYFRNVDDATEAKERAPGVEIDGHKVRCDFSITERAHTPTPGIYLGRPTSRGYKEGGRSSRRSPSPYYRRRYSRSRSRSYSPRRY